MTKEEFINALPSDIKEYAAKEDFTHDDLFEIAGEIHDHLNGREILAEANIISRLTDPIRIKAKGHDNRTRLVYTYIVKRLVGFLSTNAVEA